MKKFYLTALASMVFAASSFAQVLTINIEIPDTITVADDVHIAGNFQGWDPGSADHVLEEGNEVNGVITYSIDIDIDDVEIDGNAGAVGDRLSFKIILGDNWDVGDENIHGGPDATCADVNDFNNYIIDFPAADSAWTVCLGHCVACSAVGSSVFEQPGVSSLSIYPNPSSGVFNIYDRIEGTQNVTVFNMIGEQVLNTSVNAGSTAIDLSAMEEGVYLVSMQTATGVSVNRVQVLK